MSDDSTEKARIDFADRWRGWRLEYIDHIGRRRWHVVPLQGTDTTDAWQKGVPLFVEALDGGPSPMTKMVLVIDPWGRERRYDCYIAEQAAERGIVVFRLKHAGSESDATEPARTPAEATYARYVPGARAIDGEHGGNYPAVTPQLAAASMNYGEGPTELPRASTIPPRKAFAPYHAFVENVLRPLAPRALVRLDVVGHRFLLELRHADATTKTLLVGTSDGCLACTHGFITSVVREWAEELGAKVMR